MGMLTSNILAPCRKKHRGDNGNQTHSGHSKLLSKENRNLLFYVLQYQLALPCQAKTPPDK
jgi:hypothetical protein